MNRKQFHGGTWRYITENLDYPYYMLRDRFAGAEGESLDDLRLKMDSEFDAGSSFDVPAFLRRQEG